MMEHEEEDDFYLQGTFCKNERSRRDEIKKKYLREELYTYQHSAFSI